MSNDFNPYGNSGQAFPPYHDPYARPPRKSGSAIWLWVIGGVVVLGGAMATACCCGLAHLGLEVEVSELEQEIRDHPLVKQHIGEIQELTRNWSASIARQEEYEDDVWVFDIKGTKGSGEIVAVYDDEDNLQSAELRSSDGRTFKLR